MTVKVQLYLRSADDAILCTQAGADFIQHFFDVHHSQPPLAYYIPTPSISLFSPLSVCGAASLEVITKQSKILEIRVHPCPINKLVGLRRSFIGQLPNNKISLQEGNVCL